MNITKNIIISQKILLVHKVRTALSLSGIIIGICAVIIMVSIGKSTEESIVSQITEMGSNLLIVNAGQVKIIAGRARQAKTVTTLKTKDAQSIIAKSSGVNYAVPAQTRKLQVKYGNLNTGTRIVGTNADILMVRNYSLSHGRFFDKDENNGTRWGEKQKVYPGSYQDGPTTYTLETNGGNPIQSIKYYTGNSVSRETVSNNEGVKLYSEAVVNKKAEKELLTGRVDFDSKNRARLQGKKNTSSGYFSNSRKKPEERDTDNSRSAGLTTRDANFHVKGLSDKDNRSIKVVHIYTKKAIRGYWKLS